jgi:hypothetical protein
MTTDLVDDVIGAEHARCDAITCGDLAALDQLLAVDLTHTHISGVTQDRATYLDTVARRPRATRRGDDLRVRLLGEVAVMTGTVINTFAAPGDEEPPREVRLSALQVWTRLDGRWRMVACAASGRRST